MTHWGGLGSRLFAAQLIVIAVAAGTLAVTVSLVAPGLFLHHLMMTGEESPVVQQHAMEAFESSVRLAMLAAGAMAVIAAIALSWFVARRVSRPIEQLAAAAESVADANYDIDLLDAGLGPELRSLSDSFQRMANQLAATEQSRQQLLADLAHEIRTPLATLEVHIDGQEDGVVPTDASSYEVMREQVHRLHRLTNDLKEVSAAQEHALELRPRVITVDQLITEAVRAAGARYQAKGVHLTALSDAGCGEIYADPDRIQQVLTNILDNALRHTPQAGAVTVSCQSGSGQSGSRQSDDEHFAAITVTDDGEGIPTEHLEMVFDRFHRVDGSRHRAGPGGTGLGLTIARAIVADHGGTLTAASPEVGHGTTVTLTLPRPTQRP